MAGATSGEDPFAIFRDISQISNMWGPQAGIKVDNRPAPGGGITYGGSGSISFLAVDSSIKTKLLEPLGERFDDSNSALEIQLGAYVGYQFGWGAELQLFTDLLHVRDLPYYAGDGVGIQLDEMTEFIWGGRFRWRPSYFHYHRPQVDY